MAAFSRADFHGRSIVSGARFLHLFGDESPVALGEQKQEMQRLMLVGFLYEHGMIDDPDLTIPLRRGARVSVATERGLEAEGHEPNPTPRVRRQSKASRSRATPATPASPDVLHAASDVSGTPTSETKCLTPFDTEETVSDEIPESQEQASGDSGISVDDEDRRDVDMSQSVDDNDRKDEREPLVSTEPAGDPVNTEERSDDRAENVAPKERKVGFLKGFNG